MNNIYINKEIAKLRFTDWYHESYTDEQIIKMLDDIPASDVMEVRHAYKIDIATVEDYFPWCKCSACGYDGLFLEDEYCSYCGAKLDGEQNNE